jgi:signal transduction histidine kinase
MFIELLQVSSAEFSYYVFSALVNLLTSIGLGLFILLKQPSRHLNQAFALFATAVALWSGGYFMWQLASTEAGALVWVRFMAVGAIFSAFTYLHFVVELLGATRRYFHVLLAGYALASAFAALVNTPLMISGLQPMLGFDHWPQAGPLFSVFLFLWGGVLAYCGYLLIAAYHSFTERTRRIQALFALSAMLIAFISVASNFLLWYGVPVPPYANILLSVHVVAIGYAALRHHLFHVSVIATELLVGVLWLLILLLLLTSRGVAEFILHGGIFLGTIIAGVYLIKSVSRERWQRAQLERINSELRELDARKSEFISLAAHQLRTPLTSIKGYASMLIEGTFGDIPDQMESPLQHIKRSTDRMVKMVNDYLTISRIEQDRLEYSWSVRSAAAILDEVEGDMRQKVEDNGLTFTVKHADREISVRADTEKIIQALDNIVDNAVTYTQHGSVRVQATFDEAQQRVAFAISDTGIGLTQQEQESIFGKFNRSERGKIADASGSGLGLYIAKRIVEAHNGGITVYSDGKECGTTFTVTLPVQMNAS